MIDIKFFTANCKAFIRTIITLITISDLDAQKHSIDKYAIAFMYFSNVDEKKHLVKTLITKEIHLIDDFKANILIENDVLKSELIDVSIFKKSIYIESCDVTIFIRIQTKARVTSMHTIKSVIVSSQTKLTIFIHNIVVSNCDYIFELENTNFAIYAHVVDANIKIILIKNDFNSIVKIFRNFRLENLMKMNYSNACLMNFSVAEFALKRLKFDHKTS